MLDHYVFLNNQFVREDWAQISWNDRGFLLGDGLFETVLATDGNILFLKPHYQRLYAAAKALKIPMPLGEEQLESIIRELLKRNDLRQGDAVIRITLSRGNGERGILPPQKPKPTILISCQFYHRQIKAHKLIYASVPRYADNYLSSLKSTNYLENIMARIEAQEQGADDAVILNTDGNIIETTAANLFFVANDTLYTPPIQDGALPGIMRAVVINLCEQNQITVQQTSINPEFIAECSEIFMTNSLMLIQPIARLDAHEFTVNLHEGMTHQCHLFLEHLFCRLYPQPFP